MLTPTQRFWVNVVLSLTNSAFCIFLDDKFFLAVSGVCALAAYIEFTHGQKE